MLRIFVSGIGLAAVLLGLTAYIAPRGPAAPAEWLRLTRAFGDLSAPGASDEQTASLAGHALAALRRQGIGRYQAP